jgi:heptosyltransferase II
MQTKILIIKLGLSETLDPEIGKVPSLGDVLRTTPILWALKEKHPKSHVTWLVTSNAEPLLVNNHLINRILVWDEFVPFQLMREKFDILINLEKIAGVCALADMIDAWTKYGFRFDSLSGQYHAYEKGLIFIDYLHRKANTKKSGDYWQQVLIEMIGVPWRNQECLIGYKPKTTIASHDVGLNYQVGSKWPSKAMSMQKWQELESKLVVADFSISWQQGLMDLYAYMDWINSCEILITHDSLGLHIALALGKKVIALFGSTGHSEVCMYGRGIIIKSKSACPLMPCYNSICTYESFCMDTIETDEIISSVKQIRREATL